MGWFRRLFENAEGKRVIAQPPNVPILLFFGFTVAYWLQMDEPYAVWLQLMARLSLGVWAGLELTQGVNKFRQILGGGVLLYLLIIVWISAS